MPHSASFIPRHLRRSLKSLLLESVLFIGLFTLMGHLTVNFWERYIIQNELTSMKANLYSLKATVNNIGTAYDNLNKELEGLSKLADGKNLVTTKRKPNTNVPKEVMTNFPKSDKSTQNKNSGRNFIAQWNPIPEYEVAVVNTGTYFSIDESVQETPSLRDMITSIEKNATTLTKQSQHSAGAGSFVLPGTERCKHSPNLIHRCCRDNTCAMPLVTWDV